MGPKERRERQKESLRQEILDAARELFVEEGYENVSMRRIAEKIDYSPTTIYLYFKDKTDLLSQVVDETFSKLASKSDDLLEDATDPIEHLRRVGRAYIKFGLDHPSHYKVTFILPPQHHIGKSFENSMGQKAFNILRLSVERCIRDGKFRDVDVDAASQALWAGVHGITSLLITHPDFPWADRDEVIDLLIDALCRGLQA
jgi:AcrR family transcriptional regulator